MNKLTFEKHQPKYIGQDMMKFVANAKYEDLPTEVVTRAKHVVMDGVAVMLAGRKPREMFGTTRDHMKRLHVVTVRQPCTGSCKVFTVTF